MMTEDIKNFFQKYFFRLSGYPPFPWQIELFYRFVNGEIPTYVNIPTGCGKTKIMLIWLLAVSFQARLKTELKLPRRLVWIVNRRVVVDQATEEAEEIVHKLQSETDLHELKETLLSLSLGESEEPIAVSSLRGELADNEKWKEDPSRPSIIVGTVDMIGSKLLFRGYGDGRWMRSYHAGLLGVDTLIVLDETHLTPAFERLLNQIEEFHQKFHYLRPFHVMFLSASLRDRGKSVFTGSAEDEKNDVFRNRVHAKKMLRLHKAENVCKKIVEIATSYEGKRVKVAVFVHSPEEAQEIAKEIREKIKERRILVLTGEIRGYERDKLVKENEIFKKFKFKPEHKEPENTFYFVSTSAGEVGIDLDADHCVCDLVPIDALIQRWGRVNRGGLGNAYIDLVYENEKKEDPLEQCKQKTLKYLEKLSDVSPASLASNKIPSDAFSPEAFAPQLTYNELDKWSLTSLEFSKIDPNGEMKIDFWLYGLEPDEPDTYFVWREDIRWLASENLSGEAEELLTDFYRPLSKEKLRVPKRKAIRFLNSEKLKRFLNQKVVLLTSDEMIEILKLEELKNSAEKLNFATVFLPVEVGGLDENGYLNTQKIGEKIANLDVADVVGVGISKRERLHTKFENAKWVLNSLSEKDPFDICQEFKDGVEDLEELEKFLKKKKIVYRKIALEKDENGELIECLLYLREESDPEFQMGEKEVLLGEHQEKVAEVAKKLAEKIGLEKSFSQSIELAAKYHDEGKKHEIWQSVVLNNPTPNQTILAKGPGAKRAKIGYRHELGSYLIVEQAIKDDLALHLIAASHGWARPIFGPKAFQHALEPSMYLGVNLQIKKTMDYVIQDCSERFARLQRKLGWWNLAYLEAILKAADSYISKKELRGNNGAIKN